MDDVSSLRNLCAVCLNQLLGAVLHVSAFSCSHRCGYRTFLGFSGKLYHKVSYRELRRSLALDSVGFVKCGCDCHHFDVAHFLYLGWCKISWYMYLFLSTKYYGPPQWCNRNFFTFYLYLRALHHVRLNLVFIVESVLFGVLQWKEFGTLKMVDNSWEKKKKRPKWQITVQFYLKMVIPRYKAQVWDLLHPSQSSRHFDYFYSL